MKQRPVLVEVILDPQHVTFMAQMGSGRLVPYFIERPLWVQPGQDLDHPGSPPELHIWSRRPDGQDHPEAPRYLAGFHVYPHSPEGAAALAALGFGPDFKQRAAPNLMN